MMETQPEPVLHPEVPTSFVDLNPERNFASVKRLAFLLGVTSRQVSRLAATGVLSREKNGPFTGQFRIIRAIDAYVAHVTKRRVSGNDAMDIKKTALLQQRYDREAPSLITMAEATETVDYVTAAFQIALDQIGEVLPSVVSDPNVAALAIAEAKRMLNQRSSRERAALLTGNRR